MPTQVDPRAARRVGATLTLMGVVAVNVLATLLLPGLSTDATDDDQADAASASAHRWCT